MLLDTQDTHALMLIFYCKAQHTRVHVIKCVCWMIYTARLYTAVNTHYTASRYVNPLKSEREKAMYVKEKQRWYDVVVIRPDGKAVTVPQSACSRHHAIEVAYGKYSDAQPDRTKYSVKSRGLS